MIRKVFFITKTIFFIRFFILYIGNNVIFDFQDSLQFSPVFCVKIKRVSFFNRIDLGMFK